MDLNFKNQFYNLEGSHCNERKKNFFKLLNSTDPHVLIQNLDIQPRNYLERIFYVDILIRSKQVDKLVKVLKEGNEVLTSKILKQKWFFEEAFKNMTEHDLVNEFLPSLPYSLRMKFLKKMALLFNEERMDKIVDNVLQRYGLFVAQQFLFSCSSKKIAQILENNKITLSIEQLKRILAKDHNLVKLYFDEYKKNTGNYFNDQDFLGYLPWKYPNLYFEFQPYYQGRVKVGRNTTKAVLKINEERVLEDFDNLKNRFHISTIVRKVKDFDKEYLHQLFPSSRSCIAYNDLRNLSRFLDKYPEKKRWEVLTVAFKKAYNVNLVDHLQVLDETMVGMMPKEIRYTWAKIEYRETESLTYIKHTEPEKAFPLLKDLINVTSGIFERANMLRDLIKNCFMNKNYRHYEEVLKYIVTRHRNEDRYSRGQLMREIQENIDYELSTEAVWSYINQMIDLFRVKGDSLPFDNISQYLIFALKGGLPLDQPIQQYIKDVVSQKLDYWPFSCGPFDKEPKIKNHVMRQVMKCFHEIDSEPRKKVLTVELMKEIVNFNSTHVDLAIDLNESPIIVDLVKEIVAKDRLSEVQDILCLKYVLKNDFGKNTSGFLKVYNESHLLDIIITTCEKLTDSSWEAVFLDLVKKPRASEFQRGLLEFYFTQYLPKHSSYYGRKRAFKYFITEEPEILANYFEHVLPLEVDNALLNYSLVKLYSHLALDEKLIAYLQPLVAVRSTCESKTTVIEKLSKIMSTDAFINLTRAYVPEKSKLDLADSEQKMLYEAQCATAKALKNIDEFVKFIPLLHPFCQGDYLQSSLALLYKVLYNVNEEHATSFINVLMQRAVSARKHAVYLSFELLSQKNSLDIFNVVAAKEKDVSAKKYLFQSVLKYFFKNPTEYLLDRVITHLTSINKNDNELMTNLAESVDNAPRKFRPLFVEHLWSFFDNIEKQGVKVHHYRAMLLNTVNSYDVAFFGAIKEDFCRNLIKSHFFSNDEHMLLKSGHIHEFVIKFLLAYRDEERFQFVFDNLKSYKERHWELNEDNKLAYLYEFFERVYDKYMEPNVEFLKLFKTYWERIFSHEESFSEYVLLQLMTLYKGNTNIKEFSKAVSNSFQELTQEYGPYMNDILLKCVEKFFSIHGLFKDRIHSSIEFALNLLNADTNVLNCFIASALIVDYRKEHAELRFKIIDLLRAVDSCAVRVRCNNLLKR